MTSASTNVPTKPAAASLPTLEPVNVLDPRRLVILWNIVPYIVPSSAIGLPLLSNGQTYAAHAKGDSRKKRNRNTFRKKTKTAPIR